MNSNNKIWGTLLKVSLGLILVLSFLQVKMKFGWDPVKGFMCRDRTGTNPPSISVTIPEDSMEINIGQPRRLQAQIMPADTDNKKLYWHSNDTTVAYVDSTGLVTATSKGGRCIITAATTDGSNKSDSIIINVDKPVTSIVDTNNKVETINILNSNGEITLNPNSKFKVDVEVLPKNASNKMLKWKSSKNYVATVDDDGTIKVKGIGDCTISVTSTDGGNIPPKTIKVHVEPIVVKVTSIVLDKSYIVMNVGERYKIRATVSPSNVSNKTLRWQSSNPAIATVKEGMIVAVKGGDCVITAYSTDGSNQSELLKVRVNNIVKVASILLDKPTITLEEGNNIQLNAIVSPSNASNKVVKWQSSNTKIATVNNGRIFARKPGDCVITAYSIDGSDKQSKCLVKVKANPIKSDDLPIDVKVKRYLSSFTNKTLAREIKTLFTSNAIVKIKDEGVIVNRRNASDYIDIVSNSGIINTIKFVGIKVNSENKITELTVEEVYNN